MEEILSLTSGSWSLCGRDSQVNYRLCIKIQDQLPGHPNVAQSSTEYQELPHNSINNQSNHILLDRPKSYMLAIY